MDYVFPSNNESNHENLGSNHEGTPLFGQFPSPFLDDILQNHQHSQLNNDKWKTVTNDPPTSPSKAKRVRKKRCAGKKDRHSKIHTAQGLRDRRMRLSLHIARKFFGLQDMLGFDKASKTIEWLFCKSKEAIEEVTESVKSQNTTQSVSKEHIGAYESPLSDCEVDSTIEFNDASNKGKQLKVQDDFKEVGTSRKLTKSDLLAKELRDKARARARERTREKMMINNLEKSKLMFGSNPNNDFDQIQLGFYSNPNNSYIEESSCNSPLMNSGRHHYFEQIQPDGISRKTEDYLGTSVVSSSTYFSECGSYNKHFDNPPAGWLNSNNTFMGFLGGLDSENFIENYGFMQNHAPSTSDIHGQNLSPIFIPPSNLVHYQTHNQKD
ncbi:uncharacterized protein [Rutidosis leptorrhynchoides]|uniref:uncharacterized protein n=1 Tax=Rutidosis leptorrhynchoides TaxID=125765 RepID=UPI003A98F0E6